MQRCLRWSCCWRSGWMDGTSSAPRIEGRHLAARHWGRFYEGMMGDNIWYSTPILSDSIVRFYESRIIYDNMGYPLVNVDITMEHDHFWWVNQLFLSPFSIAMLVYQRVCHQEIEGYFDRSNDERLMDFGVFLWQTHMTSVGYWTIDGPNEDPGHGSFASYSCSIVRRIRPSKNVRTYCVVSYVSKCKTWLLR